MELKAEAARVSERLQIKIPSTKSDWRAHVSQMSNFQNQITEVMTQLAPILSKVGADVSNAIDLIDTREKNLNSRFETSISDYAQKAQTLEDVEARHKTQEEHVQKLKNDLDLTSGKLQNIKDDLDNMQKKVSDNSPLLKMKTGIANLREQKKALELQSAILQRSLTQAWLEEKDRELANIM